MKFYFCEEPEISSQGQRLSKIWNWRAMYKFLNGIRNSKFPLIWNQTWNWKCLREIQNFILYIIFRIIFFNLEFYTGHYFLLDIQNSRFTWIFQFFQTFDFPTKFGYFLVKRYSDQVIWLVLSLSIKIKICPRRCILELEFGTQKMNWNFSMWLKKFF